MDALIRLPIRPLSIAALAALALLQPGSGAAQQPATQPYAQPASKAPIPKQAPGQQAKPFSLTLQPVGTLAACPAPSLAQCKDVNYLVSGCGQFHQKTCQTLMKPEYQAYFNGIPGPANRPMFPFGSRGAYSDLKSGKYHGTVPSRPVMKRSVSYWDQQRASVANVSAPDPKTFVAHPSWEANVNAIESCEEYVYEKYYDWQRFQDAVFLCKGDYSCIYDVAFVMGGAPGIASRMLKSKAGSDLQDQIPISLPNARTPQNAKNAFFSNGSYFLGTDMTALPGSSRPPPYASFADLKAKFPANAADLDALRAALDDGKMFYADKAGPGVNKVLSPWGFHNFMRGATSSLSENEFQELEKRRTDLEQWLADAYIFGEPVPKTHAVFVHPLSEVERVFTGDPFERVSIWENDALRAQYISLAAQPASAMLNVAQVGLNGSARSNVSGAQRLGAGTPIARAPVPPNAPKPQRVLTAEPATQATWLAPQVGCPPPTSLTYEQGSAAGATSPAQTDAWNQAEVARFASCKILNLTLAEWWRLKAAKLAGACNDRGSCGCLDLGNYACDWSPKMFYEAYGKEPPIGLAYRRDTNFKYCKRWTFNGFGPIAAAKKASTAAFEQYLEETRAATEAALKNVPQKNGVVGDEFSDDAQEGDEDSWSAGYQMNTGWQIKPIAKDSAGKICQLQGQANASFLVKITTPVDGDGGGTLANKWRHAIDADVMVRANENKNQQVRYESHLLIADQEIFASEPTGYDKYKGYDPANTKTYEAFSLNHAYKKPLFSDKTQLGGITLTVWAGPIPITGSAWVEVLYGADILAEAHMQSGCADLTKFEAKVGFQPWVSLEGGLSVGVGVGGIASVGVRGHLTLIGASLPIVARTWLAPGANGTTDLRFGVDASLELASLAGRLALYVEFLTYDEEWELFRWNGVHTNVPLLNVLGDDVKIPVQALSVVP